MTARVSNGGVPTRCWLRGMELLVQAACADDGEQHGAVARNKNARLVTGQCEGAAEGARRTDGHSRSSTGLYGLSSKTEEAVTPDTSGEQPFEPAVHHGGAGLRSRADAAHERHFLSVQQAKKLSPVFGPVTPDEHEGISPSSINVPPAGAPQAITMSTSLAGGQLLQARASSTPPPQQQLAAGQQGIRQGDFASEQPEFKCCLVCRFAFAQMPGTTLVVRPRPGYCDHIYCGGCYEAVVGRWLPQRPCPECERATVVPMPSAEPLAHVGPGVATMPRTMHLMHAWPGAGPHQLNMITQVGPWGPKAAVMPGALRNDFPQRSVVLPAPARPSGKAHPGSTQPRIEGAICKRRGGKGGRRSEWACAQPGCRYVAHSSRHMMRHMNSHSGERPFACKWPGCSYRAKQREHLKTHELKHSNLKSFKCDICSFATKRKEHLKRHLHRHASDRGVQAI